MSDSDIDYLAMSVPQLRNLLQNSGLVLGRHIKKRQLVKLYEENILTPNPGYNLRRSSNLNPKPEIQTGGASSSDSVLRSQTPDIPYARKRGRRPRNTNTTNSSVNTRVNSAAQLAENDSVINQVNTISTETELGPVGLAAANTCSLLPDTIASSCVREGLSNTQNTVENTSAMDPLLAIMTVLKTLQSELVAIKSVITPAGVVNRTATDCMAGYGNRSVTNGTAPAAHFAPGNARIQDGRLTTSDPVLNPILSAGNPATRTGLAGAASSMETSVQALLQPFRTPDSATVAAMPTTTTRSWIWINRTINADSTNWISDRTRITTHRRTTAGTLWSSF
jgi:hypothetical protein